MNINIAACRREGLPDILLKQWCPTKSLKSVTNYDIIGIYTFGVKFMQNVCAAMILHHSESSSVSSMYVHKAVRSLNHSVLWPSVFEHNRQQEVRVCLLLWQESGEAGEHRWAGENTRPCANTGPSNHSKDI